MNGSMVATTPLVEVLAHDRTATSEVDADSLGGKGASLARLVTAGYPVPQTGVATSAAYRAAAAGLATEIEQCVADEDFTAEEVDAIFDRATIPDDVVRAITSLARAVGDGRPVAIRSSATVEDLHGSSFAGQYQSFLNIASDDDDAVMSTVRRVWASLWHPAPTAYRRAFDTPEDDVAMAVVFMQMIPATTAGVVFTVDPGGTAGAARVEAVEGLGESLVSGARTPDAWVVPRSSPDAAMPNAARTALEISLDIEDRYNQPQDIEWAAVEDDVFIVQARPITVLEDDDGFDSAIDDHELTTAGIVEMVPGVLPPLLWDLNHFLLGEAFRTFLDQLGIIRGTEADDRPFVRRVRGRVAIDFDQLRDAARHVDGAIDQLEQQYFGTSSAPTTAATDTTSFWSRLSMRSLRRQVTALRTRRNAIEQADVVIAAVEGIEHQHIRFAEMTTEALFAYVAQLIDLGARAMAAELGVAASSAAAHERLEVMLTKHFGDNASKDVLTLATAPPKAAVRKPRSSAAIFCGPTWVELGTEPVTKVVDPERSNTLVDELCSRLENLPGWKRKRVMTGQFIDIRSHLLRRAVEDMHEQTYRREATKAAVLHIGGEVRRAHLELGARLVELELLDDPQDIFALSTQEVRSALDGDPTHRGDNLRRRRNWISRYEAEGPLPPRFVGIPSREPTPLPEGDKLTGWASSPGRYRGRARVLTSPTQRLDRGDILVATTTDASWSPIFVRAGAVIVEQGGPLSHAAILARELGVPAVLNIAGATRILDGALATVDGDLGTVVLERGADA